MKHDTRNAAQPSRLRGVWILLRIGAAQPAPGAVFLPQLPEYCSETHKPSCNFSNLIV